MKKSTMLLSNEELDILEERFKDYKVELIDERVKFQVVIANTRLIAYKDEKLFISGTACEIIVDYINYLLKNKNFDAIGVNVAGLSDIFGPIVVCAAKIEASDMEIIEKLKLTNTTRITDIFVLRYGKILLKHIKHTVTILDAGKYNEYRSKAYHRGKILMHYTNLVCKKLANEYEQMPLIIEEYMKPKYFYAQVTRLKSFQNDFAFFTDAKDFHISALVATIIARYYYLVKMEEYNKTANEVLIKGKTELSVKQFISLRHEAYIEQIAKLDYLKKKTAKSTIALKKSL